MAVRVELHFAGIGEAMRSRQVREGLREKADEIASRARRIDPEFGEGVRVEDGTRPRGRPYSRVVHDTGADMEFGSSKTERRRVLGRAAGG